MRRARIAILAAAAAASWLAPAAALPASTRLQNADRDAKTATAGKSANRLDAALQTRIAGKASLDDVRIDAGWSKDARFSSVRIYGNGVVICDGKLQFSVKRADAVAILAALRKARFGAMPDHFGEGEEDERNEGPRLKGRVAVRLGEISKSVVQLVDGEQSAELEALAGTILAVCHGAAEKGTGAESLADGLQKLTSGALAPEALEITLQRRVKAPGNGASETWILGLEGRHATGSLMPPGKMPAPSRRLVLSQADFRAVTQLLADEHVSEIPINVYNSEYTDLSISLLNRSRVISGRKFLQMTPETHGEKQKAFDRIYEALRALYERVQKEGKTVRAPAPSPAAAKKPSEAREEEREREKRKPTPVRSSSRDPEQKPR